MKKTVLYESPYIDVLAIHTEGAFLSSSGEDSEKIGMEGLTYEDIQWN